MTRYTLPLMLLLGAGIFAGCHKTDVNYVKDDFDVVEMKHTLMYRTITPDSGTAIDTAYYRTTMDVEWIDGVDGKENKSLQQALMSALFGVPYQSIEDAWSDFEQVKNIPGAVKLNSIPENALYWQVHTTDIAGEIKDVVHNVMVYEIDSYFYDGGAHGMSTQTYMLYDLAINKLLTSSDIFLPGTTQKIIPIIAAEIAKEKGYPQTSDIKSDGYDLSGVTELSNFYIENDEIVFVFQPYEIASYSEGIIEVEIPVRKISKYLTPFALEIFNIKLPE